MLVNGRVEVEKYLYNTAVETFSTLELLKSTNTRIGTIGMFNDVLYYRINSTTVIPLISSLTLTEILNNIDFGNVVINNIITDITNNPEFITNVIDNVINDIVNNSQFTSSVINNVISKLNVEVRSLKNKSLFFAFNPDIIDEIKENPVLPESTQSCTSPTSVKLIGDFKPVKGSTSNYNVEVVGSSNYLISYSVKGGTILTNPHESPVQVSWNLVNTELASIGVGVGCYTDVVNSKYDFKFFTLSDINDSPLIYFTTPLAYGSNLVSSVNSFNLNQITNYFSSFNSLQYSNFLYINNSLDLIVQDGYYTNNNYIYRIVNGQITEIVENNV
jgi:hypothetical protein